MATLSELLLELAKEDPDQLEAEETPAEWAASMMLNKNPGGRLKTAILKFRDVIENAEGPASDAIRLKLRELSE